MATLSPAGARGSPRGLSWRAADRGRGGRSRAARRRREALSSSVRWRQKLGEEIVAADDGVEDLWLSSSGVARRRPPFAL